MTGADVTISATTDDAVLLGALLGAAHAAVYGYAVLGARLDDATRAEAALAQDSHRVRRDQLTALLVALGAEPAAPEPAHDVAAADEAAALGLAVVLEQGMALRWRDLVGGTDDVALRRLGVSGLQESALRATRWRLLAGVRPATVAFPGTG